MTLQYSHLSPAVSLNLTLNVRACDFWEPIVFGPPRFSTRARLHSLARKRRGYSQSAGRSNTISRVVPRSHTDFLSNYRHNRIWLLIVCVLVSFQKVPEPAAAGASSQPHDSERRDAFKSCELLPFAFSFAGFVLLLRPDVSVCSSFIHCFPPLLTSAAQVLLQAGDKSCDRDRRVRERQSGDAIPGYLFILHANAQVLNHLTSRFPDVPSVCLSFSLSSPQWNINKLFCLRSLFKKRTHRGLIVCIVLGD